MTTFSELTKRQQEILRFIYTEIKDNKLPPSLREIASHFGFASPRSVQDHLKALVKKGFIRVSEKKSRAIEIIRENLFSLPILGRVQAGLPTLAVEDIEDYLNLDKLILSDTGIFGLRVKGESMIEAGVMPGDIVVVRRQSFAEVGQMVVALIADEATVKYLSKQDESYYLKPANPDFKPIPLTGSVAIIGIVLSVVRKLP
jgi:repressor LexA